MLTQTMRDFGLGSFALLIVQIGQAGTAVKAAFGAQNRRDLDSGPGLPDRSLSWRAKETLEAIPRNRSGSPRGTTSQPHQGR